MKMKKIVRIYYLLLCLAPPSYEECISGTQDIMDQNDSQYVFGANIPWAPRYPVFNYPQTSKVKIFFYNFYL